MTHGEESRQIEFQLTLAQMPLPAPPKPQDGTVVERIMRELGKRLREESKFSEAIEIHKNGLKLAESIKDTMKDSPLGKRRMPP